MTKQSSRGTLFESRRFTSWAAVTEAFQAGELQAAFILAPLAMTMKRRGVPVRIVYLGHRDGTALVVRKEDPARDFGDLRGKRVAIPHRYSNQRILIQKLMEQHGISERELELIDFPPPEMPAGLKTGQFDAYIVGEPFAAAAELEGIGRPLHFTKDVWPGFISCVLAVREELIRDRPELVQELVDGIAASGRWLDSGGEELAEGVVVEGEGKAEPSQAVLPADWPRTHRMQAAVIAARAELFNQRPELLRYVLSRPPDRVRYVDLEPARTDFEEIQRYSERLGFFAPSTPESPFGFEDYVDTRFARRVLMPLAGGDVP